MAFAKLADVVTSRWRRVVLSARRLLAWLFTASVGTPFLACGSTVDNGETAGDGGAALTATAGEAGTASSVVGTSGGSGGAGSGGAVTTGGGGVGGVELIDPVPVCGSPESGDLELADQMVDALVPAHRVLYSWTTTEQEAGLRDGERLFSVGVVAGKGRGIALDSLFAFAEANPGGLESELTPLFDLARYAWPNPWATRMGFGSEDYGNRLLKIVLREEAWIARLWWDGSIQGVWDMTGTLVDPEAVTATPERIGALFFVRWSPEEGPECGSFFGGSGGYREFVLGNLGMVESYEVGTQDILDRMDADIHALTEYMELADPCPPDGYENFNVTVYCNWGYSTDAYLESLALPDEAYVPTRANLETLIDTLTTDRFTPDPFAVILD